MGRGKENADRGRGGEDAEDDQTEPVDHLREGGFSIETFFASSSENIELAISANLIIFISPPKKYGVFFHCPPSEKVLRLKSLYIELSSEDLHRLELPSVT